MTQRVELDFGELVNPYRFNPVAAQPIGRVGGPIGQREHKLKTPKLVSKTMFVLLDPMLPQHVNDALR